jgi:hypothetical protein
MWFVLATDLVSKVKPVIQAIERETGCAVLDLPREQEYFVELRLTA